MKKILITGASGFIGSFIVEKALELGYDTYAGIRKSSSKKYLTDKRIHFIDLDFSDKISLKKQLSEYKFDYIVHAAGLTKAQQKNDFEIVNFKATQNLIEALKETAAIPEKFIFVSSMAAHGPGNDNDIIPVKCSDQPHPDTLYGISKLNAEKYINSLKKFPVITLRPTGVYGPREKDYFVFFKTINSGIEPYIGLQEQYLTFIYVRDFVDVIFKAISSPIIGKTYFVSDGKAYTAHEFANITKKILNKKTFKLCVPLAIVKLIAATMETVNGWFGKVPTLNRDKYNVLKARNWLCDISDLEKDFNFKAKYYLEDGVKEAIEWYKKEKWL
ncbi:MAG: NAD(P)-dependent oxidoreductase [Bacteroidetes bacterium]|nr:NAD(P)-dependent oxidoreductase [Bacteroidota bacterium]